MDNFKIIYRILKILEKSMDLDEFDEALISPETLKISENKWIRLMMMLIKEGYICGISIKRGLGDTYIRAGTRMEITLKGLEYLEENALMKKAADFAKGVAGIL